MRALCAPWDSSWCSSRSRRRRFLPPTRPLRPPSRPSSASNGSSASPRTRSSRRTQGTTATTTACPRWRPRTSRGGRPSRRSMLRKLEAVDAATLSTPDRVSRDMLVRELARRDRRLRVRDVPHSAQRGQRLPHRLRRPARTANAVRNAADYEATSPACARFRAYVAQQIAHMREGLRTRASRCRACVLDGLRRHDRRPTSWRTPRRASSTRRSARSPSACPTAERARLTRRGPARDLEARSCRPTARSLEFMTRRIRAEGADHDRRLGAAARTRVLRAPGAALHDARRHSRGGARDRPRRGRAHPRARWRRSSRRPASRASFAEFLAVPAHRPALLRADAGGAAQDAPAASRRRWTASLPALFGRLPRLPYGVEPVPAHLAPKYTGGRYVERPGRRHARRDYWVNTYALEKRPLYTLEALTLHEAVPGHHLQIALSAGADGAARLPPLLPTSERSARAGGSTRSGSGCEAGFYQDPYSDFGRLTYEMWRACRLVVDTGLHAHGLDARSRPSTTWSRTRRCRCTRCTTETDRYISWPGQALGYKMGELKIRELRRRAETELGPRFDVRGFHDAVLANGTVPLPVLEAQVDAWIQASASAPAARPCPRARQGRAVSTHRDSRFGQRASIRARNPATGETLEGDYFEATPAEIDAAARAAERAFEPYAALPAEKRAEFLRAIAAADRRSRRRPARAGRKPRRRSPAARLESERARTVVADPALRRAHRGGLLGRARGSTAPCRSASRSRGPTCAACWFPLGPVAVFGASNFPLAFSVAGGDTVSALAAGCPVVVKAHPAHPGTSELSASAIRTAARETGMPDGVFSMVQGASPEVGISAGRASRRSGPVGVHGLAARRAGRSSTRRRCGPEPIPVFAEMGSSNPVFLLPGALQERGEAIAKGFAASVTLGSGQFCTNPGPRLPASIADRRRFFTQRGRLLAATAGGNHGARRHQGARTTESVADVARDRRRDGRGARGSARGARRHRGARRAAR